MATFEEYRERWLQQNKSLNDKINHLAAEVQANKDNIELNKTNIEYNAEGIEELASIIGGDE